jgi:uncharacterized linocin/CFP29 family protein
MTCCTTTGPVRLSVNLAPDVAAILRQIMADRDESATETIRRAIAVLKFMEDQTAAGARLALVQDGRLVEVKFPADAP